MKRVLVIGESMPLPTDELKYEDTWVYRLSKVSQNLEIVDKCVRSRSIRTLMHGGPQGKAKNLYEWYTPDLIIIHLGLTDCAPRLLHHGSKIEWIVNHTPFSGFVYKLLRKYSGRRIEFADVPPEEFKENIEQYVKKVHPCPVGIIKIAQVSKSALEKSPLFNTSINLYNDIYESVAADNSNVTLIESFDGSDESFYQTDGMHLTAKGQGVIYQRLLHYLDKQLEINILPPPRTTNVIL